VGKGNDRSFDEAGHWEGAQRSEKVFMAQLISCQGINPDAFEPQTSLPSAEMSP